MELPETLIATDDIVEDVSRSSHSRALHKLSSLFMHHVEDKIDPKGRIYPETDLYLAHDSRKYIPDLCFTSKANPILNAERDILTGVPDLILEVLSPSSLIEDTVKKFASYQNAGVKEYWIVNAEQRQISIYELVNGRYELTQLAGSRGAVHSKVLPDLIINLEDVFDPM